MSLAALGCNPSDRGSSLEDIGGIALGTLAYSDDGGIYQAVQAKGAIVQYAAVVIQDNWEAAELDTGNDSVGQLLGVAQQAFSDNQYGWVLVSGSGQVLAAASCAANAGLQATAVDGTVDDTTTATIAFIAGLQLRTARPASAGAANCICRFPVLGSVG